MIQLHLGCRIWGHKFGEDLLRCEDGSSNLICLRCGGHHVVIPADAPADPVSITFDTTGGSSWTTVGPIGNVRAR